MEVKGAWRNLFHDEDKDCRTRRRENSSFSKHLHDATEDASKVFQNAKLTHASHVGVLLICFGSPHFPILDEHIAMVRSRAIDWNEHLDDWADNAWLPGQIRCGFWCRER